MRIEKSYNTIYRADTYILNTNDGVGLSHYYSVKIESGIYIYESFGYGWENRQYLWDYIKQ